VTDGSSLAAAFAALRTDGAAGLPAVLHFSGGEHELQADALAGFVFDARTRASEVRLIGVDNATLRATGATPLLNVSSSSPRVLLSGLTLRSQVIVSGGELHLENCTFAGSSADLGGALALSGGTLTVSATAFVSCFADRGGAVHVTGGTASFEVCTFESCTASMAQGGGAMWVEGGEVTLKDRTQMRGNTANSASESIWVAGGELWYVLPAPLAHWINSLGQDRLELTVGTAYGDYPHACSAGLYGNGASLEEQSSPLCSGLCPAGKICGGATADPVTCEQGGYCPEGSPASRPCPSGRFGNHTGLISALECQPCPTGHSCSVGATAPTECSPGSVAPNRSSASCAMCSQGSYQPFSGQSACVTCGSGYFCPPGSSVRIPAACSSGSYSEGGELLSLDDCLPCPERQWCAGGATAPKDCMVGRFANRSGLPECFECAAGRFQMAKAATVCDLCGLGGFCERGAMAATLCSAGSFGNETGLSSQADCHACPPGYACGVGAQHPVPCPAGSVAPNTTSHQCASCAAGTYQPDEAQLSCMPCEPGSYCRKGASAALPCESGSYSAAAGLASNDECTPCPPGSACTTGATAPTACNPGSAAITSGLGSCVPCSPGVYQNETNATACKPCSVASYCAGEGSSAPTPCPGGTWSDRTGLKAEAQCTKVVKGQWAPTGSSAPEPCPVSGFYCPGYDAAQEHLAQNITPPGSKPILIDSGAARQTRNVTVVTFGLTLDADVSSYDPVATKAKLASLYSISADSISLTVVSGSLELQVTIAPASETEDAVSALRSTVASIDTVELTAALEVNVSVVTSAVAEQVEREYEATCPKGFWCSAGNTVACTPNTYNHLIDQVDAGACVQCPAMSESPATSISRAACTCIEGYYDGEPDPEEVECVQCPVGSACEDGGVTLTLLPLEPGYYRTGNASSDLRRCPDANRGNSSGCTGGVGDGGEGPCKEWLRGPYCSLCNVTDDSRYYSPDVSECLACEGDWEASMGIFAAGVVVVLAAISLCARFQPHRAVPSLARVATRARRLYAQLSLRPKLKQTLSFYQVVTRVADVYHVDMPDAVADLLAVFEVFNINISGIGLPMQCLGLGTYEQKLAFVMLAPLVIAGVLLLACLGRAFCCGPGAGPAGTRSLGCVRSQLSIGMLAALPWLLSLTFLVFPMVSSAAFKAFSCEDFDDGRSYLREDYAVECSTEAYTSEPHERAKVLAWAGIGLYPCGISLLYAALMLAARKTILEQHPTALSGALAFLIQDVEPAYFWWELLEAWKKLFLVGFMVLVMPGQIEQLVIAFLFSLVFLLLISIAMPYKNDDDDYYAKTCGFGLVTVFFFSLVLQLGVLTEAVDGVLTAQYRTVFGFDAALVSLGMAGSIVGAVLLVVLIAAQQLVAAAKAPTIRLEETHAPPDLQLQEGHRWHMFLSHIWGTGQDQCATIKRQLCLLLPDVSIFLDVDDLESIDALEEYVDATAVIMIFVSKGYFKSGNCLREARCTVAKQKPITLVHDPVRGGAKLDFIRDEECPDELRGAIFDGRDVIEWHRIKDFQMVSLKLLAEQLLFGCPHFQEESVRGLPLYIPGELTGRRLAFRPSASPTLFVSNANPGAAAAAQLLQAGMPALQVTRTPPPSLDPARLQPVRAPSPLSRGRRGAAAKAASPATGSVATHMLLFLAEQTFLGDQGAQLAEELRRARAAGFPVVMLHENDEENGGCEFGRFFATTPQDLIAGGLYKALALAFYPGPFMPVSVALVATALGAAERRTSCGGDAKQLIQPLEVLKAQADARASRGALHAGSTMVEPRRRPPGRPVKGDTSQEHQSRREVRTRAAAAIQSTARGKSVREQKKRFDATKTQAAGGKDYVAFMMFERYDLSGDGSIGPKELRAMCASMGKTLSDAELAEAMAQLDVDGSGQVGFDEFYAWWKAGLSKETLLDRNKAKCASLATSRARDEVAAAAAAPAAAQGASSSKQSDRDEERDELHAAGSVATKEGPGRQYRSRRGSASLPGTSTLPDPRGESCAAAAATSPTAATSAAAGGAPRGPSSTCTSDGRFRQSRISAIPKPDCWPDLAGGAAASSGGATGREGSMARRMITRRHSHTNLGAAASGDQPQLPAVADLSA